MEVYLFESLEVWNIPVLFVKSVLSLMAEVAKKFIYRFIRNTIVTFKRLLHAVVVSDGQTCM